MDKSVSSYRSPAYPYEGLVDRADNKRRNYISRQSRRNSNKIWWNRSNSNYKVKHSNSNRKSSFVNSQKQYALNKTKTCEQKRINNQETYLQLLPESVLTVIFCYLDPKSLKAFALSSPRFNEMLRAHKMRSKQTSQGCKLLEELPTEILVHVFNYVTRTDLGRLAQVNKLIVISCCESI